MLTVQLLGPLQATWSGESLVLSRRLERALLARLSLDPGRAVPASQLVVDLWGGGDEGPRDAHSSLQTLVYRLRRSLGPASALLESAGGGYRLAIEPQQVDACRFESLVSSAARNGDQHVARQLLTEALALWQGPPLADLEVIPFVPAQSVRLAAARLDAISKRVDADLATGRHALVVPELEALVRQEPYQERIWRQLMLAHYRSGSQTAALRTASRLREALVEDLGLEPDPTTLELEAAILRHDPSLAAVPTLRPSGGSGFNPPGGEPERPVSREEVGALPPVGGTPGKDIAVVLAADPGTVPEAVEPETADSVARRLRGIIDRTIDAAGGSPLAGDERCSLGAFASVADAVRAAVAIQQSVAEEGWPEGWKPAVRVGIDVGVLRSRAGSGSAVERVIRLAASANPGQIVTSAEGVPEASLLAPAASGHTLGTFLLGDLPEPVTILQITARGIRDEFPPLESHDPSTVRILRTSNSFVGRRAELAEVGAKLLGGAVVTLVAAGGTGKTRLSRELAVELAGTFRGDVHFVALEDVGTAGVVTHVATTVLGDSPLARAEGADDPLAALVDHLSTRRALLILDNCEHVLGETAGLVRSLCTRCDALSILATSRERLGVPEEFVVALRPLPVAADTHGDGAADTAGPIGPSPAAQLFCDRASSANPAFEVSATTLALIERICRAVDGLPLAIELAAARMRTITVGQMADRLSNLLSLLRQPRSGAPQRHQSLEQAIAWSFDLLEPIEQRLLSWASVFVGGFSLEAFEHLAEAAGASADGLDILESLCDKSLVTPELRTDVIRYRLAAPIREFAATRLDRLGERPDAEGAHLSFFAELGSRSEAAISGELQPAELSALKAENENFVAAIHRAAAGGDADRALVLALGLHAFWEETGNLPEASQLIESLVGDDLSDPMTFRGIAVLLAYAPMCGNLRQAVELADALTPALERELTPRQAGQLRYTLAFVHSARGDLEAASDLWAEAGRMLVGVDNPFARHALFNAGHSSTHAGRFDDARRYLEEATAVPPPVQGWFPDLVRVNRALIDIYTGRGGADELVAGALAVDSRGLRFRMMLATIDTALGLHRAGLTGAAEPWWRRLLDIGLEMGNMWTALVGLEFAAWTSAGSGDDARAAEIWACVDRTAADRWYGWWDLIEQEGAAQRKLVEGRSPDAFEAGADRGRGRALNDIADAVRRAKPNPERAPLP